MKTHPLTRKHWYMVALAAVVFGLWFVTPFIGIVALAALMAFMFHGIYGRLARRVSSSFAAALTLVISILVVVVPTILTIAFTAAQLSQLATQISGVVVNEGSTLNVTSIVSSVNTFTAPLLGSNVLSADGVLDFVRNTIPSVLKGAVTITTQVVGSIPVTIILTIMYATLFYEFLTHGKSVLRTTVALSPFEPEVTQLYLKRIGLMARAMVNGQLFISFVISLCTAILLSVFLGFGQYFFLMTVVFTLLNLIPLGCGIVVIPITLIAIVSGAFWPGLAALVLYILVSQLDAFIRPKIIPRSITLTPGLTMLAAFGGISLFGLLGVVYGPILMIIIVTSVQMYLEQYSAPTPRRRKV